jgi:hypothetical protein
MDLQGQPIPSGKRGAKVKSDQPLQEPSGPVVGDSLAAESINRSGSYSENRGAQPLGVTGQNTTTNTTDTSAARKMPSAASARDRDDPSAQEPYPEGLGGQAEYPGAHVPESGYVGGSTAAKKDLGIGQKEYHASEKLSQSSNKPSQKSTGAKASGSGGYQTRSATAAQQKQQPYSTAAAGQGSGNQDDFPTDPKYNASFNSEIGSEDDPGRLAEKEFQRRQAETAAAVTAAAVPAHKKCAGDGSWYEPLNSDQRV